jgi:hypothetical protein
MDKAEFTAFLGQALRNLSGRHITIGEDRIVEMSAEGADSLIAAG